MTYKNLKSDMEKNCVTQAMAAELLGIGARNFSLKMQEKISFTVDDIKKIRDRFFLDTSLEYLCASDGDVPTEREKEIARFDAMGNLLDDIDASPEFYEALADMRQRRFG